MLEPVSPEQRAWERSCHRAITSDVIWKLDAYRAALFLLVCARDDQFASVRRPLDPAIASQLVRAAASVSANIGEGYSRPTRADRIRFLSYALGSTRECVSWYEASLGAIDRQTLDSRLTLIERNRALLLGLIRSVAREGSRRSAFRTVATRLTQTLLSHLPPHSVPFSHHLQRGGCPPRPATGGATTAGGAGTSFQFTIELNTMLNSPWFCQR